ncbi:uncharacterized protein [Oscarella lobularis]|uniref:uncharacterized protein n=1 Tax=Oscarella lobularis TaxID=121494 RepID=UPI0033132150
MPIAVKPTSTETGFLAFFVADALAMPVHWYYDIDAIKRDYSGWLTEYRAPRAAHPTSALSMASPSDSGKRPLRATATTTYAQPPVIGRLILHDKLKYWNPAAPTTHYHQGMNAGDNTLNALCSLRVAQALGALGDGDAGVNDQRACQAAALEAYVRFMTTPGTHNDTYAEPFHRAFYRDWDQAGRPTDAGRLLRFAERRRQMAFARPYEDSSLATIGAIAMVVPFVLRCADKSEEVAARQATDFAYLTNPVKSIGPCVDLYARALHAVANGADTRATARRALVSPPLGGKALLKRIESMEREIQLARAHRVVSERVLRLYQSCTWELGSSCAIAGALRTVFFLAYMFPNNLEAALLTNANSGGENCHRGAALGAFLGCAKQINAQPNPIPVHLVENLKSAREDILKTAPLYRNKANR